VVTQWTFPTSPDPLDSSLVALRQLWLPYGNPPYFTRLEKLFSSSSKCSRESRKIFFLFPAGGGAVHECAASQRLSLFVTSCLLCGVSGRVHPPLSSVGGLATMAPPKWPPRKPPLTTNAPRRSSQALPAPAARGSDGRAGYSTARVVARTDRDGRSWPAIARQLDLGSGPCDERIAASPPCQRLGRWSAASICRNRH
jgi:hypothetical protein